MRKFGLKIALSFIIVLLSQALSGKNISLEQARIVASHFYEKHKGKAFPDQPFQVHREDLITENNVPVLYVFSIQDNQGMILVSADDRVSPVPGYTTKGSYLAQSLPPQFQELLLAYSKQIVSVVTSPRKASREVTALWQEYLSGELLPPKSTLSVGPLVSTTWDQGNYYNDSCPEDPNSWFDGRVPTGCVATALAQILKYHAYPVNGSGWHTYNHPLYGDLTANFANTAYNWTAMPNNLWGPNSKIAQLMYHCGVAVEMDYSPYASGAPSQNAAMAFIHFFNYSLGTKLVSRVNYSDPEWISLLTNELDNNRVCYYAGYGTAGHAFVLDGYDTDGYFHFNWGWSGWYNGFFDLNNLDPGGNTFNDYQEAIIGIQPGSALPCSGLTTLTEPEGSLSDGSYGNDYQNNTSCQWLIQPSNNPVSIELKFMTFNTEINHDIVTVYQGSTTAAPLLGSYSGADIPALISCTGSSLLVEFTSNASVTKSGWSAGYESKYCFPENTISSAGGTVEDGSGIYNYRNNTDCQWLIQQAGNTVIELVFNHFDTEYDFDFVDVYDGSTVNDPLLGRFSGDTLPPVLFSSGNSVLIHFISDQGVTGEGWEVSYTSVVGIQEQAGGSNFMIYPNPAGHLLYCKLTGNHTGVGSAIAEILDITGKVVHSGDIQFEQGNTRIDIQSIKPGFYLIRLISGEKIMTSSFMKQ